MTSIMRRTVRGAAAGLGALAIVAGTAACGGLPGAGDLLGGGDESEGETSTETEEGADSGGSEEDGAESEDGTDGAEGTGSEEGTEDSGSAEDLGADAEDEGDDSASDEGDTEEGGDDAATGEALSEEDLTAVEDVYFEFIQAAGDSDGDAACALITNPATGEPLTGEGRDACAEGFEGETEKSGIDPSVLDALDRSMIEATDNGDGSASATMAGQDVGITFIKADDGNWYIDGSKVI